MNVAKCRRRLDGDTGEEIGHRGVDPVYEPSAHSIATWREPAPVI
jgi:hypothetical protein